MTKLPNDSFRMLRSLLALPLLVLIAATLGAAQEPGESLSLADRSLAWPSRQQWLRVILLQDYNTRVVVLGTTLLGWGAGMVGSFTLLRKRALMGDALSHATLPGICVAFIGSTILGFDGKALPVLLLGATLSGLLGVGMILLVRTGTKLKEDTALGAVLSVFFGAGITLLGIVQQMQSGHAAGLEAFIYGKTASLGASDAQLIALAACTCIVTCLLFFKELRLLCFDDIFTGALGYSVLGLDLVLMALVVVITIVGLQAVGLVLIIALLVTPAAAARFWTERMQGLVVLAGVLGAASGWLGAVLSALFSKLPSGAMIVLVCTAFFVVSLLCGTSRGLVLRYWRRWQLQRVVDRQHVLRAIYETLEAAGTHRLKPAPAVPVQQLREARSWSWPRLSGEFVRAERAGLLVQTGEQVALTARGMVEAERLTRQHRLWELYLITHADVAPGRVDRDADAIEHVLEPEIVAELEALLDGDRATLPASPHAMPGARGDAFSPSAPQGS